MQQMKDRLLVVDITKNPLPLENLLARLDEHRRQRALRYVKQEDAYRSAVAGLLLLHFSKGKPWSFGPSGKPFIENGPFFSLSHSGDYVGIYVSEAEVGMDLEKPREDALSLVRGAFTEEEASSVKDLPSFLEAWTKKEAVAKCQGQGIQSPHSIGLSSLGENRYAYLGETYYVKTLPLGDYRLSLAKKKDGEFPEMEILSVSDLLAY